MSRPPHICTCGRTIAHSARCQCEIASTRARNRRHDARRPTARQRGYSTDWEKARLEWLAYHPSCNMCGAPATLVDHVKPHRGGKKLFWDWRNWQSLCAPCHNRHKQKQERMK